MSHTPGPWKLDLRRCTVEIPAGPYRIYAAYAGTEANARFIVQACNSYDNLLEALLRLRKAEKDCIALRHWDEGFEEWADVAELKEAQQAADEAIRKAIRE